MPKVTCRLAQGLYKSVKDPDKSVTDLPWGSVLYYSCLVWMFCNVPDGASQSVTCVCCCQPSLCKSPSGFGLEVLLLPDQAGA